MGEASHEAVRVASLLQVADFLDEEAGGGGLVVEGAEGGLLLKK